MSRKIEDILCLIADMQSFHPLEDELSRLIASHTDDELSEFDLELVSAAARPDYAEFLKRATEKK